MSKFHFDRMMRNFAQLKRELPVQVGNTAQNFFSDNFRRQGFLDSSLQKWPKRKHDDKKSAKRAILVKTGKLRMAVNRSLKTTSFDNISFAVNLPYAAVHNYGFHGTENVRPHQRTASRKIRVSSSRIADRKESSRLIRIEGNRHNVQGFARKMVIPQRKYIGNSRSLFRIIDGKMSDALQRIRK